MLRASGCSLLCYVLEQDMLHDPENCWLGRKISTQPNNFAQSCRSLSCSHKWRIGVMCGSRKFCYRGVQFWRVFCLFVFYEGRADPNSTKSGPSSARQRNAIKWNAILMAFRWRADYGPTLNAGLVAFTVIFQGSRTSILLRNPICLWFFREVGPDPVPPPPLDPRMDVMDEPI